MFSKTTYLCILAICALSCHALLSDNLIANVETAIDADIKGLQLMMAKYSNQVESMRSDVLLDISTAYMPVVKKFENVSATIDSYVKAADLANKELTACFVDEIIARNVLASKHSKKVLDCSRAYPFEVLDIQLLKLADLVHSPKSIIPKCLAKGQLTPEDLEKCANDALAGIAVEVLALDAKILAETVKCKAVVGECLDHTTQTRINSTEIILEQFAACATNILQ